MIDQPLEVAAHRAELGRADVEHLTRDVAGAGANDRVDKILDREQLIAIVPAAEHVDAAPVADPVEEDLEDAQPLRPEERLRPDDDGLERRRADKLLAGDLRLPVRADS